MFVIFLRHNRRCCTCSYLWIVCSRSHPQYSQVTCSIMSAVKAFTKYLILFGLYSNAFHAQVNSIKRRLLMTPNSYTSDSIAEIIREDSTTQYDRIKGIDRGIVFLKNQKETSAYIDANFDAILFDCDGVLYRGQDAIPEASQSLKALMKQKKKVLFVTNNAGQSRLQLRNKLSKILQCDEIEENQIVSSSYSASRYLERISKERNVSIKDMNVHIIGSSGLCDEIRKLRCNVTGGPSEDKASMSREELQTYTFELEEENGKVDAVVVGLDTEFNYRKLCIANVLLQRYPGAVLIATNEDAFDLVGSDSRHLPGNGALVKALEYCSQREAINVGKPSKMLAELITMEHSLNPQRTLFVGDRLDTDCKFGIDNNMKTAIVLTGCTTAQKLIDIGEGTDEEPLPHIIFPHMGMMGLFN